MMKPRKHLFPVIILSLIAFARYTSDPTSYAARQNSTLSGPAVDSSGVMFFSKDLVSQTARKGHILYDGNPSRNYSVLALRRDKPGEVEIHAKDTDVFYIIEGAATFATGGDTMGAKPTAPDETRGSSMTGGTTRQISKGDVVIIPAKVPHWFKEIQQPITYVTVKVR